MRHRYSDICYYADLNSGIFNECMYTYILNSQFRICSVMYVYVYTYSCVCACVFVHAYVHI